MKNNGISPGRSAPLGATVCADGVNFSLYCRNGALVELLLFDHVDDAKPARVIPLDPSTNRTYHYWHVFVPDLKAAQLYGYRVKGPFEPQRGLRFDEKKVLLDPYGRAVAVPGQYSRTAASGAGDNAGTAERSLGTP